MKRIAAIIFAVMLAGIAAASPAHWAAFDDHYFAARTVEVGPTISNLVAHWKMNDNAADKIVLDSFGDYHGTNIANTADKSVAGKINTALDFDGVNDYVTISSTGIWDTLGNTSNALTFACWYYSASGATGDRGLFSKGNDPRMMSFGFVDSGMHLAFLCKNGSDGNALWVNATTNYGVNCPTQWVHYAVTYDGSRVTNGVVLYINGSVVGMYGRFNSLAGVATNASPFMIGHLYNSSTRAKGRIDDMRVYDRVLSSNEIAIIYNAGSGTEEE